MPVDPNTLPYRPNVGALIFNAEGQVLIARRTDMPGAGGPLSQGTWQCPQGGIDEGEDPRTAVLREVGEELGTSHVHILAEHPEWIAYDLPVALIGHALGGRYRGQTQKWFALRFTGTEADIQLDSHLPAEFDAWMWIDLQTLPNCSVGFKKPIYEQLVRDFARYAVAG
ncbi:MAG: RNA pyrophosphohydrolase [Acetobacter fabarum]|jgi:putative (di)nucleoside polyphosphate hydrolase|nr:RNA pyrophosphohydrolase [Acetobacter fabarum]MCI1908395.1 RNA pyrophosphohydrolase [Acetobacter fabarum]MCI1926894.1 RNA pyrophosphohydrolase [Acetobacter fabarum]MCI1946893.1 RNA pyrophosphohydrolase [Acetobacter fabarum]MCI1987885.1 RNA pyrophosphohydrolase [Acetobacter fabarum]